MTQLIMELQKVFVEQPLALPGPTKKYFALRNSSSENKTPMLWEESLMALKGIPHGSEHWTLNIKHWISLHIENNKLNIG